MALKFKLVSAIVLFLILKYLVHSIVQQSRISKAKKQHGCAEPPTLPSKDPFFGIDTVRNNLQQMKENRRIRTVYELSHKLGFTFQSWPFGRRVISTVDPRNVQFIFATEAHNFGVAPQREKAQSPLTGVGLITSDEPIWSRMRPLIKPTFTRTQIADRELFDVHVERFLNLLPKDGSTVNLRPLFERLILDASSEFIFGESFDSLLGDSKIDASRFIECFNYAQTGIGKRIVFRKMSFLIRDQKFWDSCKLVHDYTRRHVERALQQEKERVGTRKIEADDVDSKKKYILVHELAKETNDTDVLCSQLLNVFFAGRDTPGVALTNTFFALARHPRVWAKIRQEVQGLAPEDLSFEKLKSLRYVQHSINEALRLYPPVASNSRVCLRDTVLPTGGGPGGSAPVYVSQGDTTTINFYTINRRTDIYGSDAEEFRPERWQTLRTTWEFLPFGGGPRHCPAQQLALFWISYVLVRMALKIKELRNRDEVEGFVEDLKLNMESKNGAKVGLVFDEADATVE
ncbi:cytochrome P450 [Clohesyomyces aquaticus]|uniref:Cytochrome P450 n=1 Tax=Clohesyomyces aquaticus TaxID=1231657 RepID=A0A1Y1ZTG2_9PLEO|nr:cytochrome P450 [Clohesyomyces aquaticus]